VPMLPFSQALTANQRNFNPVLGWQYEFVPMVPAKITVLSRATTAGVQLTAYSGSETIVERSPVQGGGTAGVTPSPLNTTPLSWVAAAGDRIKLIFDEILGGTPTLDGLLNIEPLI
jgi:hypothetical protein